MPDYWESVEPTTKVLNPCRLHKGNEIMKGDRGSTIVCSRRYITETSAREDDMLSDPP